MVQRGGVAELRLDEQEQAEIVRVEVVVDPSPVLRGDDRRGWSVRGENGSSVRSVRLGQVPEGWTEQVPWSDPPLDESVVVVHLDDGREGILNASG